MAKSNLPNKIIQCPDCGVDCHYVASSYAAMPFSYPGWYIPHRRGGRECLKRQIDQLQNREQIGWFNPNSKRFCYLDEQEAHPDLFKTYCVPVFVARK